MTHDVYIVKTRTNKHTDVLLYVKNKQLLDEVFVISGLIKVKVSGISQSHRLRLITLTETLIIPDITKTESKNCLLYIVLKKITTNALSQQST